MKTDIKSLFNLKHFFKIVKLSNSNVKYSLTEPSQMLIKNIHLNWLRYIYSKTYKEMPVFINGSVTKIEPTPTVFGSVRQKLQDYNVQSILEHSFNDSSIRNTPELHFDLVFPQQDAMQYFIKWQRYRKYWWSSISTTPSLFAIGDIKYEENSANVDVVAQLSDGNQPVENITINFEEDSKTSRLTCGMSLENALKILLLDGLANNTKEEYLRLHRKIAPYKISFAFDLNDTDQEGTLKELANLLHQKLESNRISAWLPDFTLPYDSQIKENLHLGVTYTAILSEETLKNGIFRLMSSSTMLGEQVHVSDFHKYAAVIFDK